MVIGVLGLIAMTGVMALCLTMFFKNYADPAVLTAIISITSGAMGSLGTMLVSTRSQPTGGTTTATLTTTTEPPPPKSPSTPTPVVVTNEPENPVQVEEAKP